MVRIEREIGSGAPIGKDNPAKMQVLHFVLPPELEPYLTRIYHFRFNELDIHDLVPATLGQMIFLFQGKGHFEFADGHSDKAHPVVLYGPGSAAMKLHFTGPMEVFGCAFSPIGFVALTGAAANHHADRVVPANARFGAEVDALATKFMERRLAGPLDYNDMIADLTNFLLARARRIPPAHIMLVETVLQWLLSGFDADVEELYAKLPMSRSTASRLITRYYGSPPKPLMRKYRALRAAAMLIDPETSSELRSQIESLFYDQPHMIREFRQFTGRTPGSLNADKVDILHEWLARGNNRLPDPKPG